jgi:hypothetical protein
MGHGDSGHGGAWCRGFRQEEPSGGDVIINFRPKLSLLILCPPEAFHVACGRHRPMKLTACLAIAAICSGLAVSYGSRAEQAPEPPIKVQALTDYLIYFFDGRRPTERYAKDWNWFDDAAIKLGVGTYAIYSGDQAIVYDTFTSVPQAKFVRDYLTKKGIKKFTVVHSHWHLDHIAGDSVYDDSDVVTTTATKDALEKQKDDIDLESCGVRRRSIPSAFPT